MKNVNQNIQEKLPREEVLELPHKRHEEGSHGRTWAVGAGGGKEARWVYTQMPQGAPSCVSLLGGDSTP